VRIAVDHLVSLIDAELAWIDRSLAYFHESGWPEQAISSPSSEQSLHSVKLMCPGTQDTSNTSREENTIEDI
jgi:hypothetical protein